MTCFTGVLRVTGSVDSVASSGVLYLVAVECLGVAFVFTAAFPRRIIPDEIKRSVYCYHQIKLSARKMNIIEIFHKQPREKWEGRASLFEPFPHFYHALFSVFLYEYCLYF